MPWTLYHQGKVFSVSDGKDFVTADRIETHGGGSRIVTTTHRQDGTRQTQSQDYPPTKWIAEDEPLPNETIPLDLGYSGKDHVAKAFAKVGRVMGEANDTFFKLGNTLDPGPDKESEMKNSWPTGLRVNFPCPQTGAGHLGTIVSTRKEDPLPRGVILICSDIPTSNFNDMVEYTGEGHGVVLSRRHVAPFGNQTSSEAFAGVPKHIGVTVRAHFEWDDVMFARGATGRLLHFDGDQATVSWNFVRSKNFYISDPIADLKSGRPPENWPNCYSVPTAALQWCRWDSNAEVCKTWPGTIQQATLTLRNDDYVVYTGSNALRISGESHYAVSQGAILRITGNDGRGMTYNAVLVGGCDEKAQGLQVQLNHTQIAPLEFPYISAGIHVEIVASVEFKKQELQGRRGVVILPTDADGDVGVQFQEDIGAGSLDGAGKSLHCLYVPVGSIQKISG